MNIALLLLQSAHQHSWRLWLCCCLWNPTAKCLPRLAPPTEHPQQASAGMRPGAMPSVPKPILEPEEMLMDMQGPQQAPEGQLFDIEWWPGERECGHRHSGISGACAEHKACWSDYVLGVWLLRRPGTPGGGWPV